MSQNSNAEWQQRDLNVLWHPCTQMKDHEWMPMIPIRQAKGVWLEDFEGKRYLDAVSSWWVNLFGHSHPYIAEAIAKQAQTLEHVMLAGFTHEPAVDLAERLVGITPPGLDRVFYAENGSSAVEIALKMSFHYWLNQGKTGKNRFVSLSNSYHGETLGALSVGHVELYRDTYDPLLLEPMIAPCPDAYGLDQDQQAEQVDRCIQAMSDLLQQHRDKVSAVIVEPLVQFAGGMRMYPAEYLTRLRRLCDECEVHLIADEIAVGFGRSGTLFACEQAGISPDFMCLSKGLTAGFLPLAAVLTHDQVYQAFYHDYTDLKGFLHSHSYTGYALGCTAAQATLDLFEQEPVLENNHRLGQLMEDAVAELKDHPKVGEIRRQGMVLAIEMVKDKATLEPYDWRERRGIRVYQHALEQGVLLRPLGNVTYFVPPYVINEEEIQLMAKTAIDGIHLATRD